ncbi:MAG: ribosome biogenesis GTP-binding protein YihA/YsxC [Desulfobacterales bacterium]|jgi:GTP-binding protein
MHVKSAVFVKSAVQPDQYPAANLPEVAFAGRSNVGKSSLINTLVNRRSLVKTSRQPGRTQLINFFDVNSAFTFVDLPGYGYAKVPAAVRKKWRPMIENYLTGRATLRGVVVLLDIRRDGDPKDLDLINWLTHLDIPVIATLTKADKFSKTKQAQRQSVIRRGLPAAIAPPILFSAKTGQGKEQVWETIAALLHG